MTGSPLFSIFFLVFNYYCVRAGTELTFDPTFLPGGR